MGTEEDILSLMFLERILRSNRIPNLRYLVSEVELWTSIDISIWDWTVYLFDLSFRYIEHALFLALI